MLAVRSSLPKFKPWKVSVASVDVAVLRIGESSLKTGASYVKERLQQPRLEATMTAVSTCSPSPAATAHTIDVVVTQEPVMQMVSPYKTVWVGSVAPKFRPPTVTLELPQTAALTLK
jgi:hypothetical protein